MVVSVKARSKDVEKWLDEHHVSWEFDGAFPVEDISIEESLQNQARLHEPINRATVETYAAAMERGDEFPAIVLIRPGIDYLAVTADGNHRLMAAVETGAKKVGAYVVRGEPSSARMVTLTMEANARHGQPTNLAERLEQAVYLVAQGATQKRAAASCNVPVGQLQARLNKERAETRGLEAGVKPGQWSELSRAVRIKLATIATDEGLKAAASLAYTANLSLPQVTALVSEVNATRSGAKQVAVVKAFASTLVDKTSGPAAKGKATPKQRYALAVSGILSLPDSLGSSLVKSFAPNERKAAAKQARDAARKLTALASALEK